MKKIQILGTGCPKCVKLMENAKEAAKQLGLECEFEKVSDMDQIVSFGVMMTPALAVDGVVKSSGHLLTPEQIKKFLA